MAGGRRGAWRAPILANNAVRRPQPGGARPGARHAPLRIGPPVQTVRETPRVVVLKLTAGDFADVPATGAYRLVFIVFNTRYNLLTQDEQVRCFANVAAHLTDDGVFVVEAFVPASLHRLQDDQYVNAERIDVGEVRLDVGRHDPVAQIIDESHVVLTPAGVRLGPIVTRSIWPSELDLLARLAGLRLQERWGGWQQEPFTAASRRHVSVYGR